MSKKKSLGHNPLAYSMRGNASFDFIRSNEKDSSSDAHQKTRKINKKIVSYYIEVPLVKELKRQANEAGISYSQFVSDCLKKTLIQNEQ